MLCAENSSLQEQAGLRQGDPISATGAGICASGGDAQPRDGGASNDDNTVLKADVQNLRDENNRNRVLAETQYYADQRIISDLRAAALQDEATIAELSLADDANAERGASDERPTAEDFQSWLAQIDAK